MLDNRDIEGRGCASGCHANTVLELSSRGRDRRQDCIAYKTIFGTNLVCNCVRYIYDRRQLAPASQGVLLS
jgi:hypothetical protein